MKKIIKSCIAVILTGILSISLFGCGRGEGEDGTQTKATGEVYVPEYEQLAIEFDYLDRVVTAGDKVYMIAVNYDEESGQQTYSIYKYDMMENKADKLDFEMDENSSVYGLAINQDGNLMVILNHYIVTMDEEDNVTDSQNTLEMYTVSPEDGSVIESREITELMGTSEYSYVQYFNVDGQGNLYLCDGDSNVHVVDKDLHKICDITTDGWIYDMVTSKEGDVYVAAYGENGIELKKVDMAAKTLGEAVNGIDEGYGNFSFSTGLNNSILISTNDGISTFDIQTEKSENLFKWLDVDINSDNLGNVGELSDGRIWVITRDYSQEKTIYELVYISLKDASEVVEKEEITFGTIWLDYELRNVIINFNKTNEKYRINVKEYGGDDYQAGITQFNADLTTASCPDIIDLSSLDFSQYASKGILEDLYPYMDKSGMNREDYLENILKAYGGDGKLYGIMSKFYIDTTMAKTALVGDASGWTLSEMLDFVEENNPENVFRYGSRSSIFQYCIYNNIDEFINWETGECSFNGDEFIRTLEFAAQFPEEYDYNEEEEGIASMLHADKVLLMQDALSSVQEFQMMNGMFGEAVTYIGYPNSERKGNLIRPTGGSIGMSSRSKCKEGVWEFMKTILSDEYQDSLVSEHGGWGFPVKKSALEKQFELDMTPDYYEDEDGNQIENPKTTWGYDDFTMEIMAATQEEVDTVRELISSAEKLTGSTNEQLTSIITEESEAFFKGQKSAEDTAGIIQNRIQIYVNENR